MEGSPGGPSLPNAKVDVQTSYTTPRGASSAIWWASMQQQMSTAHQHVQQHMQRLSLQVQTARQSWKPPDISKGLGMKIDVDFLNPAITGLKQQWEQLPVPVKEVLPYAGVALAAGVSVQRFYHEHLTEAHQRYGHLREDHTVLQQQYKQLEAQLEQITDRRSGALVEIQMAEAVAKATTAAAAAAEAAAAAAVSCTSSAAAGHQRR